MASTLMEILWAPLLAGLGVLVGWWLRRWAEYSARSSSTGVTDPAEAIDNRPNHHGDPLTGLSDCAPFVDDVKRHVAEFKRGGLPISVLFMRIDNLDEIIDLRGTQGADELLVAVSRFLKATIRDMDHIARFDDRTFGVVLPDADDQVAQGVIGRLREVVSSYRLPSADGQLAISVCVGAVQVQENESADRLLRRAERVLDGDSQKFCHVLCATQAD